MAYNETGGGSAGRPDRGDWERSLDWVDAGRGKMTTSNGLMNDPAITPHEGNRCRSCLKSMLVVADDLHPNDLAITPHEGNR